MRVDLATWFLVSLLLVQAEPGWSQTRSPSGRHRPTAEATRDSAVAAEAAVPDLRAARWSLGVFAGSLGGGDLFRVEVMGGAAIPWRSLQGGGFSSARFNASLERNAGFGVIIRRSLGSVLSLRADLEYARLDVAAEALLGQSGAVLLYDRMSILRGGLGLDVRLATAASYPYLGLGGGAVHLGPELADDLEQTVPGAQAVLGYHQRVGRALGLQLEARVWRIAFDADGFQPQAQAGFNPEVEVENPSALTFFEVTVCFVGKL